jgi:hypothetical protein
LAEEELPVPPVEFGCFGGGSVAVPVITLSTCERIEKERIIRLDAYTVTISFTLPESPDGELCCYAYAVEKAIAENPSSIKGFGFLRDWRNRELNGGLTVGEIFGQGQVQMKPVICRNFDGLFYAERRRLAAFQSILIGKRTGGTYGHFFPYTGVMITQNEGKSSQTRQSDIPS